MKQLIKITLTDALSFLLFCVPVVLIVMATIPYFSEGFIINRSLGRTMTLSTSDSHFYYNMALYLFPFTLIFYLKRLLFIKNIVQDNHRAPGKIVDISFTKDRGYVIYEYRVGNQTYKTTNRIMKSNNTQNLTPNQSVTISYSPSRPSHAFIHDIYKL